MTLSVADDPIETDQGSEPFHVHDQQSANWVVRKVVESREYRERIKQWAQEETEREERAEKNLLFLYGFQLEQWVRNELHLRADVRRSLHLPAGRVGFRKGRPPLVVADASALAAWAHAELADALVVAAECRGEQGVRLRDLIGQHLPDVEVGERVLIPEVRRHIEATGEIPRGAEVGAARETFFVK